VAVAHVDVVIVAYRSKEMLRTALDSLRAYPPSGGASVWVVDNDSRDGTAELIRAEYADVHFIQAAHNLGFSRANNIAIPQGSAPFVLALNPDAALGPGTLDRLLEVLEQRPEVGIVGPKLVRPDGSFDHASRRSFPTIIGALGHFTGLGKRPGAAAELSQYRAPDVTAGAVDAVNGAFMLIRRHALDLVGLFDEGYWMYMEDLDLCFRFREAGWLTWYEPSATARHIKAGTSGVHRRPRLNCAFHYGMYRFYRTHYARRRSRLINLVVYGGIAVKLVASLVMTALNRRLARV
jgi:GT2 family glycosyltransferase